METRPLPMGIATAGGAFVVMTILHYALGWPESLLKVGLISVAGGIGGAWAARLKAKKIDIDRTFD